jgi:hypothetical protein
MLLYSLAGPVASVAVRSSPALLKGDTNALDDLCYLTHPVVTWDGDINHARRLYSLIAHHRHCGGIDQSDSGQTACLEIWCSNSMGALVLGQDSLILIPGVIGAHEVWHVAVLVGLGLHWKFVFQFAQGPPHASFPDSSASRY